ncbi:MAG: hypothetical protein ACR2H4_01195 [Pyrinomonadaceae bacterium]
MKKNQPGRNARRVLKEKLGTVLLSALVLAMAATLILVVWQKSTQRVNTDYEGKIEDRWGDYSESDEGSRPRLRLAVETEDGKRFIVKVDPNVYESAKVGMRIKSSSGRVVLIDTQQGKTAENNGAPCKIKHDSRQ